MRLDWTPLHFISAVPRHFSRWVAVFVVLFVGSCGMVSCSAQQHHHHALYVLQLPRSQVLAIEASLERSQRATFYDDSTGLVCPVWAYGYVNRAPNIEQIFLFGDCEAITRRGKQECISEGWDSGLGTAIFKGRDLIDMSFDGNPNITAFKGWMRSYFPKKYWWSEEHYPSYDLEVKQANVLLGCSARVP